MTLNLPPTGGGQPVPNPATNPLGTLTLSIPPHTGGPVYVPTGLPTFSIQET